MTRRSLDGADDFRSFYEREITDVLAYLIAMTGDRGIAEDLAQEAFARAYRDWQEIRGYASPGGWVRRVAHNLAASRFRRTGAEARAMLRLRGMRWRPTDVEPPRHDEAFWAEVRELPERQAQAVVLHYLEDRPVTEIAELMGCSENTAKVHLHRARRRLAERLQLEIDEGVDR